MKINLNPMAQLVLRAERRINFYATVSAQDLAHDRKRQIAQSVLDGATPTDEFANAAKIEGITPQALATLIIAKPDVMMIRENARRSMIVQVRSAKTPTDVEKILADNSIGGHPADKLMETL